MKYKLLSSLDGTSWTETGVDQGCVPFLSENMAVDQLLVDQRPGWPNPTQFIRVEMSEGSYGSPDYRTGYFTCRYVIVRGKRAE
jgi:hypothetical protein